MPPLQSLLYNISNALSIGRTALRHTHTGFAQQMGEVRGPGREPIKKRNQQLELVQGISAFIQPSNCCNSMIFLHCILPEAALLVMGSVNNHSKAAYVRAVHQQALAQAICNVSLTSVFAASALRTQHVQ